jgi:protein XagA
LRAVPGLIVAGAFTLAGLPAFAQAWVTPRGDGQLILKFEAMRADEGFDPVGDRAPLPAARRDEAASLFAEYGVADRFAVLFKGDWQSGEDAFVDYDGRGPLELGVRWQVWRDERGAVSLQASVADGGEGRNAGYAAPGEGERDWEVRLAAGRNFSVTGRPVFVEVQSARRMREGLPDETRADLTVGIRHGRNWTLLAQVFGGAADDDGPRWVNLETSLVRGWDDWSLQLGWRTAVWGRETPASSGPVVGIWRRF